MKGILITNALLVNEGKKRRVHVFIRDGLIERIIENDSDLLKFNPSRIINAEGKLLLPGVIDDHVHFREPGLTRKADIYSESKAAVAGGVTSFMEMPNTLPQTTTLSLLDEKFSIASKRSLANYSFYLGATNENIDEITGTDPGRVCGIKLFIGSSTGNMLVDNPESIERIFSKSPVLIATHCEDEKTIRDNLAIYKEKYGDNIPFRHHADIRSENACYISTSFAIKLARKYNSRLHILHVSTAKELTLFNSSSPIRDKKITSEACVNYLLFSLSNYENLGWRIKWNPSLKNESDRKALVDGLRNNLIDVVATDHAPHLIEEKDAPYTKSASGAPSVQHSLVSMIELSKKGFFPLEMVVDKMCHSPAELFRIDRRGFIKEGYYADLVLIDPDSNWTVNKTNLYYKCGWSPLEDFDFSSKVTHTFVNGRLVYENGQFNEEVQGKPLVFNR